MGDGYANPIVGAGGDLIRAAIRSLNYKPGLLGWSINQDGTAEFQNITARGDIRADRLTTGAAPDEYIDIYNTGSAARIDIHSDNVADEVIPARISFASSFARLEFDSPDWGFGTNGFSIGTPLGVGAFEQGDFTLIGTSNAGGQSELSVLNCNIVVQLGSFLRLLNSNAVTLASTDHAFQIGADAGANMAFDRNTIQARSAGAAAALDLNALGGGYKSVDMRGDTGIDAGALTTAATGFASLSSTANVTIPYAPSGAAFVYVNADIDNSVAANGGNLGFEIRTGSAAGALQLAASTGNAALKQGTGRVNVSMGMVVAGLPTTGNLFCRAMFASDNVANTATFRRVHLTVIPMP